MRVLSIVVLLAILPAAFCAPQSYPPPAGTTIENARANPPFWQDNVACNVDPNIPHYTPHYNLTAIANLNQTYRLSTADVTGPLNENVTSKFLAYWPTVNIIPYHYGSGSVGLCLAGKNTTVAANNLPYCDMAVISREIAPVTTSSTELENFEYKLGYQPMEVPVMGGSYNALGFEDALLFFVNGANPLRNVSLAQLDAIISTTRNRGYPNPIRTWDQLGVTDPAYFNQTINVYSSTLGNGFNVFINRVVMQGGSWYTGNLNQSSTVFPLGTYVTLDKFGLGFSGVSYLNQSGITVNVNVLNLAWGNNCTAVPVSQPTVCARTWPLSRFIYYYANLVPGTTLDPVEYEYLNYLLSYEGQTIMRQAQGGVYFPLPYATLMDIRSRFLVINNPPAFVDGTGSLYFNQTTYCPGTAPVTTTTPFPSNTTAPPTSGAAAKAPALQWILSSALLAILSWMAATMK